MIVTKPPTVAAVLALKICKVFQNYQTVSWGFDTEIYVSFIPFIFVLFLVTFGDEVTTLRKYHVIFVVIECIFLSQGRHYDSFPVFTFIRCQLVFDIDFVYILQGKIGKNEKSRKKITQLK